MRDRLSRATFVCALLLVAGCSTVQPSSPSSPTAPPATTSPRAEPTSVGGTPLPSVPSQSDTAWGRIWDALPPSFPLAPNSRLATETGAEPSSGDLEVPETRDLLVQFYRAAFRGAGFEIGTDGPLEDGSVTVTANDGAECRIELSIRGVGAQESLVSVLYGAGCPFE